MPFLQARGANNHMSLKRSLRHVFYFLVISFYACNDGETGNSKSADQANIFQHYSVVYREGNEKMEVYAQFRIGGDKGTALTLSPPSNIQFDDSSLTVSGSSAEAMFYNQQLSLDNIYGEHNFVFTDFNKKQYRNTFLFDEFRLINLPLSVQKSQSLNIQFQANPLKSSDYIQVTPVDVDSSFSVTYTGSDSSKYIVIPPTLLQSLPKGQMKFAATLYRRIPLKEVTTAGGYIEMMYTLNPVYINLVD